MSDTLLTAIIEGQIITGYQSDVEHSYTYYYGAEAYSKHPSGSVRGQREEETC